MMVKKKLPKVNTITRKNMGPSGLLRETLDGCLISPNIIMLYYVSASKDPGLGPGIKIQRNDYK